MFLFCAQFEKPNTAEVFTSLAALVAGSFGVALFLFRLDSLKSGQDNLQSRLDNLQDDVNLQHKEIRSSIAQLTLQLEANRARTFGTCCFQVRCCFSSLNMWHALLPCTGSCCFLAFIQEPVRRVTFGQHVSNRIRTRYLESWR